MSLFTRAYTNIVFLLISWVFKNDAIVLLIFKDSQLYYLNSWCMSIPFSWKIKKSLVRYYYIMCFPGKNENINSFLEISLETIYSFDYHSFTHLFIIVFTTLLGIARIESKTSSILGKCSTIKFYSAPNYVFKESDIPKLYPFLSLHRWAN